MDLAARPAKRVEASELRRFVLYQHEKGKTAD